MLRQRVLTALVLIPLVVGAVLWLPTGGFALVLGVVLLLAADEWTVLAGLKGTPAYGGFLAATLAGVLIVGWALSVDLPVWILFLAAAAWWLITSVRLWRTREISQVQGPDYKAFSSGLLVLIPCWAGLVWIHAQTQGSYLVLFLMILIWVADSGAYFAGKRWGKRRLQPVVSPGKTLEGASGALAGGLLWSPVLVFSLQATGLQVPFLLLLCLLTVVVSIAGDLYESLLKRSRGLKDSGTLLPGHGGVMDRIDSLTAAAPVFALGLYLVGEMAS